MTMLKSSLRFFFCYLFFCPICTKSIGNNLVPNYRALRKLLVKIFLVPKLFIGKKFDNLQFDDVQKNPSSLISRLMCWIIG